METFLNICFQNALSKDVKKKQLHSLTLFKNYLPLGGANEVLCFQGETNSQQSCVTPEEVSECGRLFFHKRNTWASFPGSAAAWSHTEDPPPHPHPHLVTKYHWSLLCKGLVLGSNNINHKHYIIENTLEGSVSFRAGLSHSKGTQWKTKGESGFRCGLI